MKKTKVTVAAALALAALIPLQSCLGSFALTNKVLAWNHQVGDKLVNEIVFVAFWILPVYEITALADLLVINSIEFWSGENPVVAQNKPVYIDGRDAHYRIVADARGYTITNLDDNTTTRLNFDSTSRTWSVADDRGDVPFLTYVDDTRVRVASPAGGFTTVELSQEGLLAYRDLAAQATTLAQR